MSNTFLERVSSPHFEEYTKHIDDTIEAYKAELHWPEDASKNKIQYSGYAVDRAMIHELERLKRAPYKRLVEIQLDIANAGQPQWWFKVIFDKIAKILGISN